MSVDNDIIFDRVGHVEILVGDHLKSFEGLDFRFNITKLYEGGVKGNASIGILGLNRAHIQYLSTFLDNATNLSMRKRIKVYAGYRNSGEHLIFDGDIMLAAPTTPPDNWLNITAFTNGRNHTKIISGAINGNIRYGELIRYFAEYIGLEPKVVTGDERELNRVIHGFDCSGSKADIIDRLNSIGDLVCVEDTERGVLWVGSRDFRLRSNTEKYVVNYKTGMVGIPKFLFPNVSFSMLINSRIRLWDTVRLESEYVRGGNGDYVVRSIKYNGQLRGGKWNMDIDAIRSDIYQNREKAKQKEAET